VIVALIEQTCPDHARDIHWDLFVPNHVRNDIAYERTAISLKSRELAYPTLRFPFFDKKERMKNYASLRTEKESEGKERTLRPRILPSSSCIHLFFIDAIGDKCCKSGLNKSGKRSHICDVIMRILTHTTRVYTLEKETLISKISYLPTFCIYEYV